MRRFVILPMVAFLSIAANSATPAAPAEGPQGIYLSPYPYALRNGDWERAMAIPGVDGTAVVLNWPELSDRRGSYDFTELDRRMAMARAHRLAVELVLPAGKGVPAFMFSKPPAGFG